MQNYILFKEGDELYNKLTQNGEKRLPDFVEVTAESGGVLISKHKCPIKWIGEDVFMMNYSERYVGSKR